VDQIATMPAGQNGLVQPESAVVLKSVTIETWPLQESHGPDSTE